MTPRHSPPVIPGSITTVINRGRRDNNLPSPGAGDRCGSLGARRRTCQLPPCYPADGSFLGTLVRLPRNANFFCFDAFPPSRASSSTGAQSPLETSSRKGSVIPGVMQCHLCGSHAPPASRAAEGESRLCVARHLQRRQDATLRRGVCCPPTPTCPAPPCPGH